MYGRYEFTEGRSNKYWEIEPAGRGMAIIRWGRIGRIGGEQTRSEAEAFDRAEDKIAKGYIKVSSKCGPEGGGGRPAPKTKKKPAPKTKKKPASKTHKTTTFEEAMEELAKVD